MITKIVMVGMILVAILITTSAGCIGTPSLQDEHEIDTGIYVVDFDLRGNTAEYVITELITGKTL